MSAPDSELTEAEQALLDHAAECMNAAVRMAKESMDRFGGVAYQGDLDEVAHLVHALQYLAIAGPGTRLNEGVRPFGLEGRPWS